jgi:2-polyprenyl-6-methoxyphenol hydroxylase-like FAD-dependent oxidoreductase
MLNLTWKTNVAGHEMPVRIEAIRLEWVYWAEKIAEPFRSAYLAVASDPSVTFWCDRLAEWRTEPWDNRNGRVTLAGDAAHPMTYRKLHLPWCLIPTRFEKLSMRN